MSLLLLNLNFHMLPLHLLRRVTSVKLVLLKMGAVVTLTHVSSASKLAPVLQIVAIVMLESKIKKVKLPFLVIHFNLISYLLFMVNLNGVVKLPIVHKKLLLVVLLTNVKIGNVIWIDTVPLKLVLIITILQVIHGKHKEMQLVRNVIGIPLATKMVGFGVVSLVTTTKQRKIKWNQKLLF